MKTMLRVCLRRLRFTLLAVAATSVILLGVLAGLTQLAMPWLMQHPQHVEHWLSQRLGRQITVGHLDGRWVGGGPLLALDNVHIAGKTPDQPVVTIPHAELAFDLLAAFKRNRAFSEFRLAGVELKLVHEDGEWKMRDLDVGASAKSDEPFSMGALGALEITGLKLDVEDAQRGVHLQFVAPVLRVLNRGAITRVLGRVRQADTDSLPVDLVADLDFGTRSGEVYFGGRDIDLSRLPAGLAPAGIRLLGGHGAVQVWTQVAGGRVDDVRVRVALQDAQLAAGEPIALKDELSVEAHTSFDKLAFVARWLRAADGWSLDVADIVVDANAPAAVSIERHGDADNSRWAFDTRALSLEPLGALAMLSSAAPPGLRRWLYLAHPRGTLEQGDLHWNSNEDYTTNARLRGVELASAEVVPGVDRLDLDLTGDADALLVQLPSKALRVDYPRVFRKPFLFAQFGGDIVARREQDTWVLETDRIGFEGEGYGGELLGSVDITPGHRPSLDLYALVAHADVVAAKLFWPTTSMSPKAIEWLDRALVGGRVVEGRAAIRGDLVDWPFHNHAGRFIARAEIDNTTLDYNSNWPRAENVHAMATFINDGMQVDVDAAEAMGNKVSEATATIADFGPNILNLFVKGEGSGANLLGFLRATPIGKRYQEQIKDLALSGRAAVAFTLDLPIKDTESLELKGNVDLSAAKIDHNAYGLHFLDASGAMHFNQKGFQADQLDVLFRERKSKLSVAVGNYVEAPAHAFEAKLTGVYPVSVVFADVPALLPMFSKVTGESQWTARVAVDQSDSGNTRSALSLDSDLAGIAIDLPLPLAKSAASTLPFHLDLDLPYAGKSFRARLGDIVGINGRVPAADRPLAARIEFGSGATADPTGAGITVGGRMAQFDFGAWMDLVEEGSGGAGSLLRSLDVRADDFMLSGRHFENMRFALENTVGATTFSLDGSAIQGTLELPRMDVATRGISAKFSRIHWPEAPPGEADETGAFTGIAPALLPPLHVEVEDFKLGNASFGSARFESHPKAGGMQVDTLESHSPNVTMMASGTWMGNAQDNRSQLTIRLSAQSLGGMMDALGFPGLIEGGNTKATIDAGWKGPPSGFALAKLDGTLDIDVAEGRILDVEPGAGRIFGLFSLTEVPRRLSLDFTDFFKSGLGFNSIVGTFRLADGNAFTDGLKINSPAADIVVTGRTGLRAKDYDQVMDVAPRAGATLPIVGALAAGPVGAAAGLVMQGILNKPIGKAVARRYKVSGSWDKPQITSLARAKTPRGKAAQNNVEVLPAAPAQPPAPADTQQAQPPAAEPGRRLH